MRNKLLEKQGYKISHIEKGVFKENAEDIETLHKWVKFAVDGLEKPERKVAEYKQKQDGNEQDEENH